MLVAFVFPGNPLILSTNVLGPLAKLLYHMFFTEQVIFKDNAK